MNHGVRRALPERVRELVEKVRLKAETSDSAMVEAASHLRELCSLVLTSGRKWEGWARRNLGIGASKRRMLMQIARAENPQLEARRLREMNAERQRRHRKNIPSKSDLSDDQRQLIKWTQSARPEDVRDILQVIQRRKNWSIAAPHSRSELQQPAL